MIHRFQAAPLQLVFDAARLIDEHPNEWVAIYDGKVYAAEKSFRALARPKKKGLTPSETIIRFIDASGRKLIL